MKKIDVYEIAIKILGLYLVSILFRQFRDLLIFISAYNQQQKNPELFENFDQTPSLIVASVGFLAMTGVACSLVFKTKKIAKFISKPTDYQEEIILFADRKSIYEISMVMIGLLMSVLILPEFIVKLKNHVDLVQQELPTNTYEVSYLITAFIQIVIGIIAISNAQHIASFLTRSNKEKKE